MSSGMKYYNYKKVTDIDGDKLPENLHLVIEARIQNIYGGWDDYGVYFVDSSDNKVLLKTTDKGVTVTTVETRAKSIARTFLDRDNNVIYFVDSEYDNLESFVWRLDLSDDSVDEIDSAVGNIYDVWIYDSELYIIFFASDYELLSGTINPDGDDTANWNASAGGGHWALIDDGDTPDEGTYVYATSQVTDKYTMETIDLSGYDSGKIYQVKAHAYGYRTGLTPNTMSIDDNAGEFAGATTFGTGFGWKTITFSGLDLDQAWLDSFIANIIHDVFLAYGIYVASLYFTIYFEGDFGSLAYIKNITTDTTYTTNMGDPTGRSWEISQVTVVGDQFHFNWKWSNENVEHWKYDVGDDAWTELEDCGAGTELPVVAQHGISYNEDDDLFFILGVGVSTISTIVSDTAANIDNDSYILYSAIELDYENVRSEKDFYVWFNKDALGTDPALADKTGIECAITTGETAQQVSDIIQTAIESITIITGANGGGTSTTITCTNHYNGVTTDIIDGAVPTGLAVATGTPGVANTKYLYSYNITGDILEQLNIYNIALQLNRAIDPDDIIPFSLERAFDFAPTVDPIDSKYLFKIYKISKGRTTLYALSELKFLVGSYIAGITARYLFISDDTNGAVLYENVNFLPIVKRCLIKPIERNYWKCTMYLNTKSKNYPIRIFDGMFLQVIDSLSSSSN